eukprot:TRINITY_DN31569_c0_g1_i1.p1 TRINITY_DN31569_c0_g1~~TRINITY_DN31569_c0_g1_i1.p1  ORF type:complete len:282 (-),score=41.83 TRINITY_DN31569_c0_g1_i1:121-966(-)
MLRSLVGSEMCIRDSPWTQSQGPCVPSCAQDDELLSRDEQPTSTSNTCSQTQPHHEPDLANAHLEAGSDNPSSAGSFHQHSKSSQNTEPSESSPTSVNLQNRQLNLEPVNQSLNSCPGVNVGLVETSPSDPDRVWGQFLSLCRESGPSQQLLPELVALQIEAELELNSQLGSLAQSTNHARHEQVYSENDSALKQIAQLEAAHVAALQGREYQLAASLFDRLQALKHQTRVQDLGTRLPRSTQLNMTPERLKSSNHQRYSKYPDQLAELTLQSQLDWFGNS